MLRTVTLALGGLAAGLAVATLLGRGSPPSPGLTPPPILDAAPRAASHGAEAEPRLAAIEAELKKARRERAALAQQLAALDRALGAAAGSALPSAVESANTGGGRVAERFTAGQDGADALAERIDELVAGGFAPDRAQWIAEREAKLRMDTLYSRYEAARSGEPPDRQQFFASQDALRSELGEADYERYLAASGRATDIPVGRVLTESPAESAGLKPGDRIVAYGGQRVFDLRELNALTLEGSPGEPVAVDVVRDGATLQLYLPRGPLGIFASRRGR